VRVLTWNLWWRYGPWQQRREAIASTLAELAPDLCGLQEVWGDQSQIFAAELADRLGMHWCWAARPAPSAVQRVHGAELLVGNAVLSRWPILRQAEVDLPVADGQERVAVQASIDTPDGQLPFFATHFSHRLIDSATRVEQATTLARFVADHADRHPYPPVVTGDLNAHPESDEIRLLSGLLTAPVVPGQVLLDAWRFAEPGQPGTTWDHRNPYLADDPTPDARIDYVLVGLPREGRGRVRAARLAGNTPVDGVWPSDHFAVLAELDG
jgi:endonuclease/exonuclease/phosphatase family metal-dependent hydrolase